MVATIARFISQILQQRTADPNSSRIVSAEALVLRFQPKYNVNQAPLGYLP